MTTHWITLMVFHSHKLTWGQNWYWWIGATNSKQKRSPLARSFLSVCSCDVPDWAAERQTYADLWSFKLITCTFAQNRMIEEHFNHLNAELNPICYLLALLAHHFLHVNRIRVKSLTFRLLMSYIYIYIYIYIYGAHILDVSRSHTTTHHSR